MTTIWGLIYSTRRFMPPHMNDDLPPEFMIATLAMHHARNASSYRVEEMTDQLDIYCGQRKVATYMCDDGDAVGAMMGRNV